jgi:hypothetical protein
MNHRVSIQSGLTLYVAIGATDVNATSLTPAKPPATTAAATSDNPLITRMTWGCAFSRRPVRHGRTNYGYFVIRFAVGNGPLHGCRCGVVGSRQPRNRLAFRCAGADVQKHANKQL